MAEELIAGVCSSSGGWWWCTAMSGGFDWAAAAVDMFDVLPRSCNESSPASVSDSSITFQDVHFSPVSAAPAVFDSVPAAMATSGWSQPLFGTAGGAESCLHELFQGDMSSGLCVHQESPMQGRSEHSFTEQSFSVAINGARLYQESLALPPALQNESSRSSSDESLQLTRSSPPKQQLQLSNTTTSPVPSAPWSFDDPMPTHLPQQSFDEPFNCSDQRGKSNSRARDSTSTREKRSATEPALKKPRIETPSPLPTFKVRKEKLGDRITALQQLVSPFGKTDTASVLHEAIDYIKFLHDQVRVLSSPHTKSGHQIQQSLDKPKHRQGPEEDLRSRGLCLVPVSDTFAVARETAMDFWTPFLGGIKL
ncbi:hypothetical protein MUK42_19219 [Musa troglodytarum]|uniref:BHLH domain-containing protein n=1 Tax=Musa troglodytarum TaxID=320322 RepID=A0A9E7G0W5_9LILI|nr:hypothetical protein MUK42_19219 [Musa troglodytarum]